MSSSSLIKPPEDDEPKKDNVIGDDELDDWLANDRAGSLELAGDVGLPLTIVVQLNVLKELRKLNTQIESVIQLNHEA